jgi:hypothetical protein
MTPTEATTITTATTTTTGVNNKPDEKSKELK